MGDSKKKVRLDIVTPDRIEYSEDVDMVIAPGIEGYVGILPGHIPFITRLRTGILRVIDNGEEKIFAVSEGYMEVVPAKVIILAEAAEMPEEIDVERALSAKKRAEERMATRGDRVDFYRAQASLQRALNRLKVAGRRDGNQT